MRTSWFVLIILGNIFCTYGKTSDVLYTGLTKPSSVNVGGYFDHEQTRAKFGSSSSRRKRQESPVANVSTFQDHHDYYTSRFIKPSQAADDLWFELSSLIGSGVVEQNNVSETIIQDLHRYYEVWDLMFNFPFYGHIVNSVAVTTGGFLYTGSFLHDSVHLTQFIAPLQADFNPSLDDDSRILVYSTVDRFTAQWEDVYNHDHNDAGPFTFQVSLFPNGTIHFVYREIPLPVSSINNDDHPVEVGLADAFYYDVQRSFFIIRYIYEYSRISLNASDSLAHSAYIIDPLPNCVLASNCTECIELTSTSSFECSWCPDINRCSDGLDRFTQEWIDNDCSGQALTQCDHSTFSTFSPSHYSSSKINTLQTHVVASSIVSLSPSATQPPPTVNTNSSSRTATYAGAGVVILVVIAIIVAISIIACVLVYGYKRPTSKVGLFMIEHRPKARSLNRTAKYEMKSEKILLD